MRIIKENTIGLVIDIQERLLPVIKDREKLIKNCQTLIQGLYSLGIKTLVTQQYTKGLGATSDDIKSVIPDFIGIYTKTSNDEVGIMIQWDLEMKSYSLTNDTINSIEK